MHISAAANHEFQCDLINRFGNVCTAGVVVKITDRSRLRLCENAAPLNMGEKSTSQIGSGSTIARAPTLSRPQKQHARRVFTQPRLVSVAQG